MTENENISEIILSKMFDEHVQVNIDCEWRKVVCLDDIGSIIRRELKELNEEIQQYRSIGTVSKCREAVEKQRAKKYKLIHPCKSVNYYQCLVCGGLLHINENYCGDCGQAILWEED